MDTDGKKQARKDKEEEKNEQGAPEEKNGEVATLQEQIEECETKFKRALADYQNLEKRTREERVEWIKTASKDLLSRMLPALDHLEAAVKGAKESGEQSGWLKGVELTVSEFRRVFEEEGLRPVQTETFDPNIHEAVEAREGPEGKIVDVFQMGYTFNNKLVRAAKVAVGKG
ncbi:MAG: nucleotide exchange factor GrpE, partial [bacterium]|nr:nucleotide exchange factor GrpE [bacterium]